MAMIPRHQLWRQKYAANPYMRHLSSSELEQRIIDISNLLLILAPDGKISVGTGKDFNEDMWVKYTHALAEMESRYGPFPNGFTNGFFKNAELVNPTHPTPPRSKSAIDSLGGVKSGRLYKFAKKRYIDDMFNKGLFRVAPASYYNDPSLNSAIRDDELVFNGAIAVGLKSLIKSGDRIDSFGRLEYSVNARTNYYVSCFASNYTYREFDDFGADACLVIKEPRAFLNRFIKAGEQILSGYNGFSDAIKYLDPIVCDFTKIDVNFSKHFKYAYQNEYRVIWAPKEPATHLEPVFLEIGPLSDIAEVITI